MKSFYFTSDLLYSELSKSYNVPKETLRIYRFAYTSLISVYLIFALGLAFAIVKERLEIFLPFCLFFGLSNVVVHLFRLYFVLKYKVALIASIGSLNWYLLPAKLGARRSSYLFDIADGFRFKLARIEIICNVLAFSLFIFLPIIYFISHQT